MDISTYLVKYSATPLPWLPLPGSTCSVLPVMEPNLVK